MRIMRIVGIGVLFVFYAVLPVVAAQQEQEIYATITGAGGVRGDRLIDAVKKVAGGEYAAREIIVNGATEFLVVGRDSKKPGGDLMIVTGGPPFDSRVAPERLYTRVGVKYAPDAWSKGRVAPVSKMEVIKNLNGFLESLKKELPYQWQNDFMVGEQNPDSEGAKKTRPLTIIIEE